MKLFYIIYYSKSIVVEPLVLFTSIDITEAQLVDIEDARCQLSAMHATNYSLARLISTNRIWFVVSSLRFHLVWYCHIPQITGGQKRRKIPSTIDSRIFEGSESESKRLVHIIRRDNFFLLGAVCPASFPNHWGISRELNFL